MTGQQQRADHAKHDRDDEVEQDLRQIVEQLVEQPGLQEPDGDDADHMARPVVDRRLATGRRPERAALDAHEGFPLEDGARVLVDRLANHRRVRVGVADAAAARDDDEIGAGRPRDALRQRLQGL